MRAIIILLAVLTGAVVLIRSVQPKPKKQEEENFSGLIDGASSIASSLVLLVFVIVGIIIVVGLFLVKKASENPDRALEVAGKTADVASKFRK